MESSITQLASNSLAAWFDRSRCRTRAFRRGLRAWLYWSRTNVRRFLIIGGAAVAVVLTCVASVVAQDDVVRREYAIKAGVLGVLGKCVTWPEGAVPAAKGEPLKIGIFGKDPFVENGVNQLDRFVARERLNGRNIVVKRFSSAKDYEFCHILFISSLPANEASETVADRVHAARNAVNGATVLIVGESTGLARQGAVANLIFDRTTNLIRLEVNPDAAARAGLKLAPDLLRLKLVQIVRDSKG